MALPSLQSTLLAEILADLPEETAQLQEALLASTAKYRADLHSQLASTLKFQQHVTRTHEKLAKKLKRTVRVLEEHNKSVKVDVASLGHTRSVCEDVETLSKEVMGRLMGLVDRLDDDGVAIDGDRFPLLKRVLGQEGFEVIEMPSGEEENALGDVEQEESVGENEGDQTVVDDGDVTEQAEEEGEEQEQESTNDTTDPGDIIDESSVHEVPEENEEEKEHSDAHEDSTQEITTETHNLSLSSESTQPDPKSTSTTPPDELQSIESTISKYQSGRLLSLNFPLPAPASPSISPSIQSVSSASISTVQGRTYAPSSSANEALKRFI